MTYKGLVADNVLNISEALFEDLDWKLSFPRGVFSDYLVEEGNYMHSGVSKRNETNQRELIVTGSFAFVYSINL